MGGSALPRPARCRPETGLETPRRKAPMPPLEGEVPNEREAEGFVTSIECENPSVSLRLPTPLSGAPLAKPEAGSIQPTALFRKQAGGYEPPLQGAGAFIEPRHINM